MCVCVCVCVYTCMLSHFSCVRLFVTLWSLTLCDCSPPGSSVHGILQARILEWVAMPSYMYIYIHIYVYTYTCILICIYMYMYIYI